MHTRTAAMKRTKTTGLPASAAVVHTSANDGRAHNWFAAKSAAEAAAAEAVVLGTIRTCL